MYNVRRRIFTKSGEAQNGKGVSDIQPEGRRRKDDDEYQSVGMPCDEGETGPCHGHRSAGQHDERIGDLRDRHAVGLTIYVKGGFAVSAIHQICDILFSEHVLTSSLFV